ncbi:MAG: S-layer homology domain-containing protein [Lachnospiraceae bacterium]|nr:S-layer homology domain-containing protein [Lachnospiraceae bacterium]
MFRKIAGRIIAAVLAGAMAFTMAPLAAYASSAGMPAGDTVESAEESASVGTSEETAEESSSVGIFEETAEESASTSTSEAAVEESASASTSEEDAEETSSASTSEAAAEESASTSTSEAAAEESASASTSEEVADSSDSGAAGRYTVTYVDDMTEQERERIENAAAERLHSSGGTDSSDSLFYPECAPLRFTGICVDDGTSAQDSQQGSSQEENVPERVQATSQNTGYYYTQLSAPQKAAYRAYMTEAANPTSTAVISISTSDEVTEDDMQVARYAIEYDRPDIFWFGYSYKFSYGYGSNYISGLIPTDVYSSEDKYEADVERYNKACDSFMSGIDTSEPPAAVAMKIHDKLISWVSYDYEGAGSSTDIWPHTAYNALVLKSAVCDGYSKAYEALLYRAGITVTLIIGSNHAWNSLQLGGDWYEVDTTWDDQDYTEFQYKYFNLTTAGMSAEKSAHTRITDEVAPYFPTASGTHFSYSYMKDCGKTLDAGMTSEGREMSLGKLVGGTLSLLSVDTGATSWELKICENMSGSLGAIDKLLWKATSSLNAGTALSVTSAWTRPKPVLTVTMSSTSGDMSLSLSVEFDNGAFGSLSCDLPVSSAADAMPFLDLGSGSWVRSAVWYVYSNGLMSGTSATTFRPNDPLTRGMFATILYRMAGKPAVTYSARFSDVPSGKYYSLPVTWASNAGLISGYGDTGRFGPADNITRAQIAKILYLYAKSKGYDLTATADLSGFADKDLLKGNFVTYMKWAVTRGLISGTTSGSARYLRPGDSATRAQCAKMIKNFLR